MKLYLVQIDGYIRGDVLDRAQACLYHEKACGGNSDDPTVVYHYNSEGYECPFITNKQLPDEVQKHLGAFIVNYAIHGNETPDNPSIREFNIAGYDFEVHIVGFIKGYNSDGSESYEA